MSTDYWTGNLVLGYSYGDQNGPSACKVTGTITLTAGCEPELCEYNFTVPRRYLISTLYSDELYNYFYINSSSASIPFYVDGTNASNVTAWVNAVQSILDQNGGGQVTATFTSGV